MIGAVGRVWAFVCTFVEAQVLAAALAGGHHVLQAGARLAVREEPERADLVGLGAQQVAHRRVEEEGDEVVAGPFLAELRERDAVELGRVGVFVRLFRVDGLDDLAELAVEVGHGFELVGSEL